MLITKIVFIFEDIYISDFFLHLFSQEVTQNLNPVYQLELQYCGAFTLSYGANLQKCATLKYREDWETEYMFLL
jgi:hypothetical protein